MLRGIKMLLPNTESRCAKLAPRGSRFGAYLLRLHRVRRHRRNPGGWGLSRETVDRTCWDSSPAWSCAPSLRGLLGYWTKLSHSPRPSASDGPSLLGCHFGTLFRPLRSLCLRWRNAARAEFVHVCQYVGCSVVVNLIWLITKLKLRF